MSNEKSTKKPKASKKELVSNIVSWAIFIPLISFMLFLLVLQVALPDRMMGIIGFRTFLAANTGSMEPEINTNDLVAIRRFDFNQLQEGDIVSFKSIATVDGVRQSVIITHQIVEVFEATETAPRHFRTRGMCG